MTFNDLLIKLTDTEKLYLKKFLEAKSIGLSDEVDKKGGEVFILAMLNKQINIAKELIQAGVSIYQKVSDQSFLAYAAENGNMELVTALINLGTDRFEADNPERALRLALSRNRDSIVDALLKSQPYHPVKDHESLLYCVKFGGKVYLDKFLSLTPHSEDCLIPALNAAIMYDAVGSVKLLIKHMNSETINKVLEGKDLSKMKKEVGLLLSVPQTFYNEAEKKQQQSKLIYSLGNLELAKAIFALYKLATETQVGIDQKSFALKMTADVDGLYSPLTLSDVKNRLSNSNRVRSLGYFQDLGIEIEGHGSKAQLVITDYIRIFGLSYIDVLSELNSIDTSPVNTRPVYQSSVSSTFYGSAAASKKSSIDDDKTFKKSDKDGILYEGISYVRISDEKLIAYGFKPEQIKREERGIDHIVYICKMPDATSALALPDESDHTPRLK